MIAVSILLLWIGIGTMVLELILLAASKADSRSEPPVANDGEAEPRRLSDACGQPHEQISQPRD
jgi:hypothetical protein